MRRYFSGLNGGSRHGPFRSARSLDASLKARNLTRLRRIEAQLRELQLLLADDHDHTIILSQVASVQEALRAVSRKVTIASCAR